MFTALFSREMGFVYGCGLWYTNTPDFRALCCFSEVSVIPSLKVTCVSLHCTDTWTSVGVFPISVSGSGLYHENNFLHFISCDPLTVFPVALIHIKS